MTSNRPDLADWMDLVRGKCREVARHYEGIVELDDLVQEAALWWYSVAPELLWTYLQDKEKSRLRRAIFRVARDYGEKQRRIVGGPEVFIQATYRPAEILALLPVALDPDGIPDGGGVPDDSGIRSHGNLAEGGNVLASMVDVRRALAVLPADDQGFLHAVEDYRGDWDRLAPVYEIAPDSARRRYARIAERMAAWLNNEEDAA